MSVLNFTSQHLLTSNELLVLDDGHVGLQAGDAEELPPWDANLINVRTLPVVQATPRGENQHPVTAFLP